MMGFSCTSGVPRVCMKSIQFHECIRHLTRRRRDWPWLRRPAPRERNSAQENPRLHLEGPARDTAFTPADPCPTTSAIASAPPTLPRSKDSLSRSGRPNGPRNTAVMPDAASCMPHRMAGPGATRSARRPSSWTPSCSPGRGPCFWLVVESSSVAAPRWVLPLS